MSGDDTPERPLLRVVRGTPTAEELAALVAVVSARAAAAPAPAPRPRSGWSQRAVMVRVPLRPGPGAWRASGRRR